MPRSEYPVTPGSPLADTEIQILRWLAEGLSNDAIASCLSKSLDDPLTVDGVKARLKRMYVKLEAVSRANAVHRGYEKGYLTGTRWLVHIMFDREFTREEIVKMGTMFTVTNATVSPIATKVDTIEPIGVSGIPRGFVFGVVEAEHGAGAARAVGEFIQPYLDPPARLRDVAVRNLDTVVRFCSWKEGYLKDGGSR